MAAGYCYFLGINSNAFFLKDNKKPFILGLNVPKVTAYEEWMKNHNAQFDGLDEFLKYLSSNK